LVFLERFDPEAPVAPGKVQFGLDARIFLLETNEPFNYLLIPNLEVL